MRTYEGWLAGQCPSPEGDASCQLCSQEELWIIHQHMWLSRGLTIAERGGSAWAGGGRAGRRS